MPCLSGKFDPAIGPLINVGVLAANNFAANIGQVQTFPALLDTGASITCISRTIIQSINLKPIGMRLMTSATHSVPVNQYLVDLLFPFGAAGYVLRATQVMEFMTVDNTPFQILVGRDIICRGVITLSFDGHFSYSL